MKLVKSEPLNNTAVKIFLGQFLCVSYVKVKILAREKNTLYRVICFGWFKRPTKVVIHSSYNWTIEPEYLFGSTITIVNFCAMFSKDVKFVGDFKTETQNATIRWIANLKKDRLMPEWPIQSYPFLQEIVSEDGFSLDHISEIYCQPIE